MRTQDEINRQIEGLKADRKSLPEFSLFGDNNWEVIDESIYMLESRTTLDDYDEEDQHLFSSLLTVADWLTGAINEDLFDAEL